MKKLLVGVMMVLAITIGAVNQSWALLDIVVILVDDLDVDLLKVALDPHQDGSFVDNLMPNLKQYIIDQGTTFTNSFVTTSGCCPSRATFLTGQYSHNHGVKTNFVGPGHDPYLTKTTLPGWLQRAGYKTAFVGKPFLIYWGEGGRTSQPFLDGITGEGWPKEHRH